VIQKGLTDRSLGAHKSRTPGILFHQIIPSMLEEVGNTKVAKLDDLPVRREEDIVGFDLCFIISDCSIP
jgi:hypothetical protein